jgi:acyl transferase domain-containing protein
LATVSGVSSSFGAVQDFGSLSAFVTGAKVVEDVVIAGMSCTLPGCARNPQQLWSFVSSQGDAVFTNPQVSVAGIRRVTLSSLTDVCFLTNPQFHSKPCGFLNELTFDYRHFKISKQEAVRETCFDFNIQRFI